MLLGDAAVHDNDDREVTGNIIAGWKLGERLWIEHPRANGADEGHVYDRADANHARKRLDIFNVTALDSVDEARRRITFLAHANAPEAD